MENIIDYLTEPLRRAVKDENPNMHKTVALCVAKLYELEPKMTEEQGFIEMIWGQITILNVLLLMVTFPEKLTKSHIRHANEVGVELARRFVTTIGRCAIKIGKATERCIHVKRDLINIGEYAENTANAADLTRFFLDNSKDVHVQVRLQLLAATVKLFLKKSNENQALVQEILQVANMVCDIADICDRAYIYWWLLSTDSHAAKAMVLPELPLIADENQELSPALMATLMSEIGTLASVYHNPVKTSTAGKK
ncbi:hypothetical protein MAM1_0211c08066 [Mucor ambiguus]|uniref:Uncharacterized protein n=1 Tax=Mucor ambiguus TaxID=91626 RepID=A0A0C9MY46_9FUNG|nr:hypothetical protein MAM1_0211c08066 [Mucor ambiguus]